MKFIFAILAVSTILFPSASYAHSIRHKLGAVPAMSGLSYDDDSDGPSEPDTQSGDDFLKRPMGSLPNAVPSKGDEAASLEISEAAALEAAIADDVVPFQAIPHYYR